MLIELVSQGRKPDLVLTADPGAEKPETYAYLDMMRAWMASHGINGVEAPAASLQSIAEGRPGRLGSFGHAPCRSSGRSTHDPAPPLRKTYGM